MAQPKFKVGDRILPCTNTILRKGYVQKDLIYIEGIIVVEKMYIIKYMDKDFDGQPEFYNFTWSCAEENFVIYNDITKVLYEWA